MPIMICHTTAPSLVTAEEIANHLVTSSLGACVSIKGPFTSVYRWNGAIERSEEYGLTIKTTKERVSEVEQAIRSRHPYEVPELLWIEAHATGNSYEQWVEHSVRR